MPLHSVDPATGETTAEYAEAGRAEIAAAIDAAHDAFARWRSATFDERAVLLKSAARLLRERREPLARMMAGEMGKQLREGLAECDKCASACEHYAVNAQDMLSDEPAEAGFRRSRVSFRPLGVVLAVMPWNFPLWQVFRFAAPALMAGNAVALKHASNVTGCALEIGRLVLDAGFPEGLFRVVVAGHEAVEGMIGHPRVRAVTLTGSTPAGSIVAAQAGKAVKKTVLELGGSDPYLILGDADLESAAGICSASRLINSGQSCIAAKRFVVVRAAADGFTEALLKDMSKASFGPPLGGDFTIGPLARRDLRDELHRQVTESVARGASVLLGGFVPDGPGAFYPPTVLCDVKPGMPAYGEELFGPVASIIVASDEEDAIRIANDTSFGLGAAVFSADEERAERIALDRIEAGCVFVNGFVRSDPSLPFGGVGQSGYGRELGAFGIREFVNVKTVVVV